MRKICKLCSTQRSRIAIGYRGNSLCPSSTFAEHQRSRQRCVGPATKACHIAQCCSLPCPMAPVSFAVFFQASIVNTPSVRCDNPEFHANSRRKQREWPRANEELLHLPRSTSTAAIREP